VFVTPETYLESERAAAVRSEYISGETLPRPDSSPRHSCLIADALIALANLLEAAGSSYDVLGSQQLVRVAEDGPLFYADLLVLPVTPTFDGDGCLRDPVLIVEVLSDSTEGYDRGEKFRHYRRLASLRHYLLVAQDRVRVEHYRRQGAGFLWAPPTTYTDLADTVPLPDLGIDLPLAEVYRRVRFA
jgi:Uma2 family endonuclease